MTKQNNTKIQQEQGRSMVEMLGVLAVVGVLSIGGIAGYTYAMNRHYTNEILAGASERAVLIASQIAFDQPLSLREFTDDMNKTGGGTFDTNVTKLDGEFGIKVTGVKEAVCENIVDLGTENSSIQAVTKADDYNTVFTKSDCEGDENSFLLIYNSDVGNEESEASKGRCLESEKVTKYYDGGDCCNEERTGKFCPDEEVPSCTISDSNLEICKTMCSGVWTGTECCVYREDDTKTCCEAFTMIWAESQETCCWPGNELFVEECCNAATGVNWYQSGSLGACCSEPLDGTDYTHTLNEVCCDAANYVWAGGRCLSEEAYECEYVEWGTWYGEGLCCLGGETMSREECCLAQGDNLEFSEEYMACCSAEDDGLDDYGSPSELCCLDDGGTWDDDAWECVL